VRYEVEANLARVMSCNCSICQKRGALLTFVPAAKFTLISGEDDLTDYQFNKKIVRCRSRTTHVDAVRRQEPVSGKVT
jgi:hypothetical protein